MDIIIKIGINLAFSNLKDCARKSDLERGMDVSEFGYFSFSISFIRIDLPKAANAAKGDF